MIVSDRQMHIWYSQWSLLRERILRSLAQGPDNCLSRVEVKRLDTLLDLLQFGDIV